jgi:hypothetical protein
MRRCNVFVVAMPNSAARATFELHVHLYRIR